MADNLTNVAEAHSLNFMTGNTTTDPTLPFEIALLTANGSDTAAGTEVAGGSYARQPIDFTAATSGNPSANDAVIEFPGMPAVTVTGFDIYDDAGIRWFTGAATVSKAVGAGEVYRIQAGALTLTLS